MQLLLVRLRCRAIHPADAVPEPPAIPVAVVLSNCTASTNPDSSTDANADVPSNCTANTNPDSSTVANADGTPHAAPVPSADVGPDANDPHGVRAHPVCAFASGQTS